MFIDYLKVLLPVIIYILLIVLLIVGIVLAIKALKTMDKVDNIVNNVNNKLESLDGLFHIIDFATDRFTGLTDKVVELITGIFNRILHSNKKREEEK